MRSVLANNFSLALTPIRLKEPKKTECKKATIFNFFLRYLATASVGMKQGVDVIDLNTKSCVLTFGGDLEMEKVQDVLALPGKYFCLTTIQ